MTCSVSAVSPHLLFLSLVPLFQGLHISLLCQMHIDRNPIINQGEASSCLLHPSFVQKPNQTRHKCLVMCFLSGEFPCLQQYFLSGGSHSLPHWSKHYSYCGEREGADRNQDNFSGSKMDQGIILELDRNNEITSCNKRVFIYFCLYACFAVFQTEAQYSVFCNYRDKDMHAARDAR